MHHMQAEIAEASLRLNFSPPSRSIRAIRNGFLTADCKTVDMFCCDYQAVCLFIAPIK